MSKFRAIIVAILVVATASCAFVPRRGDLLFCVANGGAMSQAITDATATDSLSFDHVALFTGNRRRPTVLEASPRRGVSMTSWHDFRRGAVIVVMRVNADCDIDQSLSRAKSHIGEPYDWSYLPDNGKSYCSELVEEAYVNRAGRRIFTAKPMNFLSADGTMPQFWTDLFARLGEPVPQGVQGTNPNDMAAEPCLTAVKVVYPQ